MRYFRYKFIDELGVVSNGVVLAANDAMAETRLGLDETKTLIYLRQRSLLSNQVLFYWNTITIYFFRTRTNHTRELKTFLESGLSLNDAIKTMQTFVKNRAFLRVILDIEKGLKSGDSLSTCLERHPKSFSQSYVAAIRGGEVSGRLLQVLVDSVALLEWEQRTLSRFRTLMTLPTIMFGLLTFVLYLMLFFLIPRIIPFLERSGRDIPTVTQFLISARDVISVYLPFVPYILMTGAITVLGMSVTKRGRYWIDYGFIHMPVIGFLYRTFMTMKLCKTFLVLNDSGIAISESLTICKKLFKEGVFEQDVHEIVERIKKGVSLSAAFQASRLFPPLLCEMLKSAEETSSLNDKLDNMGRFYSSRLENRIDALLAFIEPLYISIVSGYIALLLFGFYVPMMSVAIPK